MLLGHLQDLGRQSSGRAGEAPVHQPFKDQREADGGQEIAHLGDYCAVLPDAPPLAGALSPLPAGAGAAGAVVVLSTGAAAGVCGVAGLVPWAGAAAPVRGPGLDGFEP